MQMTPSSNHVVRESGKREKACPIRVVVRCRPRSEQERVQNNPVVLKLNTSSSTIDVTDKQSERQYAFDSVYSSKATQEDVFSEARPLVDAVLQGYNATIFAYGQTGTGKTHTMEGKFTDDPSSPSAGLIPRSVNYIFEQLENNVREYSVKISFLELYNEELTDLMSDDKTKKLRIFSDATGGKDAGVMVSNLEETHCKNTAEVLKIARECLDKRHTAETLMNHQSSRSHTIFTITVHSKASNEIGEDVIKTGKLYLVDLAGSECIGRSGAVDMRAKEAGKINKSLLTLGRVINALVDRLQYVPYRDSKLTRLLKESLGGRAKTVIIATVSPCKICIDESVSTLDYAHRAKNIKNKPVVNQKMTHKAYMSELLAQITQLKRENEVLRTKNGVILPPEQFEEMTTELKNKTTQLEEIELTLEAKIKEYEELQQAFTVKEEELHHTQHQNEQLTTTLDVARTDTYKLHEKIGRKQAVETDNHTASATFRGTLESRIGSIESKLVAFIETQSAGLEKLQARVTEYAADKAGEFDQLKQQFSDLSTAIAAKEDALAQLTTAFDESEGKSTAAFQDKQKAFHTDMTKQLRALQTSTLERMAALHESMESQRSQLAEWQDAAVRAHQDHLSSMQAFTQTSQEKISALKEALATGVDSHVAGLTEQAAELRAFKAQQAEQAARMKADMMRQFEATVEALVEAQQEQLATAVTGMEQCVEGSIEALHSHHAHVESLASDMDNHQSTWRSERTSAHDAFVGETQQHHTNVTETADEVFATIDEAKSDCKSAVREAVAAQAANHKAVVAEGKRGTRTRTDMISQSGSVLEQAQETRVEGIHASTTFAAEMQDNLGQETNHWAGEIAFTTEQGKAYLSVHRHEHDAVREELHQFVLRKDQPTGDTPEKKEYDPFATPAPAVEAGPARVTEDEGEELKMDDDDGVMEQEASGLQVDKVEIVEEKQEEDEEEEEEVVFNSDDGDKGQEEEQDEEEEEENEEEEQDENDENNAPTPPRPVRSGLRQPKKVKLSPASSKKKDATATAKPTRVTRSRARKKKALY